MYSCVELDKFVVVWLSCCVAVILLNVFFIALTRWRLYNTAGCTALMLLFHLFLLTTFVWINIEIFANYQMIADFISYEQLFMLKRILIGCGNDIFTLQSRRNIVTRMWANAQRDGRPAEYRWRPLFNAAEFG